MRPMEAGSMAVDPARLEVPPEELRRALDPASLPFETTAEVEPLRETIGQPRALEAIELGLDVRAPGYNLYLAGAPGSGRTTTITEYLVRRASHMPLPPDWVYVHSFTEPDRPRAIRLPAGAGSRFAADMEELVRAASREVPRALESDEYERRRSELMADVAARRDAITTELAQFGLERGYAIQPIPNGFVTVPLKDGHPLTPEHFERLTDAERDDLDRRGAEVQARISESVRAMRKLEREAHDRLRELDREVVRGAVDPLLHELRATWAGEPAVLAYADEVEQDLPEHFDDFRQDADERSPFGAFRSLERDERLMRYRVNVLVDNGGAHGAPVVLERNPTYYNLLGRIEYRAAFGTMVTDLHHVKPGALQRANGGFLVLQVADLLRAPLAWEALKRALSTREARVENLGEQYSPNPAATLRPEPIPLDVKVVLVGSPLLHHLLCTFDDDFRELFTVKADFAPDMDWSDEHVGYYAAFVSRVVGEQGLRHFDAGAVARVVEEGSRRRDDQRRLSTRLLEISQVITEASYRAGRAGHELVRAEDVDDAIARRRYRSNLLEERVQEAIVDGTIAIETEGVRVGRVNGLAVVELGDLHFGRPSRVTATVALGEGTVTSIEREIELSGPIHSKGVLTLTGYLTSTYAQRHPLALAATLTFEQSYDEVEGDSASSTELYALLSALAGIPLSQGIAVTGSVNQHGDVQAVGGVTTKIEGFFDVCSARGLTGNQGVVVPATNVRHLMLRRDVVQAVEEKRFHIWSVRTIDEGLELLTGRAPGTMLPDGTWPEGTVHRAVADRLAAFAACAREFRVALPAPDGGGARDARPAPTEAGEAR
jgi:lon-related putative ATP-dependent protease